MPKRKLKIDLNGPNGNAWFLMGKTAQILKSVNRDPEPVVAEMKAGNYEKLISVMEREIGDHIELVNKPQKAQTENGAA